MKDVIVGMFFKSQIICSSANSGQPCLQLEQRANSFGSALAALGKESRPSALQLLRAIRGDDQTFLGAHYRRVGSSHVSADPIPGPAAHGPARGRPADSESLRVTRRQRGSQPLSPPSEKSLIPAVLLKRHGERRCLPPRTKLANAPLRSTPIITLALHSRPRRRPSQQTWRRQEQLLGSEEPAFGKPLSSTPPAFSLP